MSVLVVERVMSITRAEFLRLLPLASEPHAAIPAGDDCMHIAAHEPIRISFQPQPDTAIASLRLPRLRVRIEFSHDLALQRDFMRRFDCVFQRGGG